MKRNYNKHIDFIGSNGRLYRAGLRNGMDINWDKGPFVGHGFAPTNPPIAKLQDVVPVAPSAPARGTRHQSGHQTNEPRLVRQPHYVTRRMHSGSGGDAQPTEAHYQIPVGFQNLETHVKVPATLAVIVAVPVAILGGFASGLIGYNPFVSAFIIFWLTFLMVAIWRIVAGDRMLVQKESFKHEAAVEEVFEDEDKPLRQIPGNRGPIMVKDTNESGIASDNDWRQFGKAMAHPRYLQRDDSWSRNKLKKEYSFMTQGVFNRCFAYLQDNNMVGDKDWRNRSRLNQKGWEYMRVYLPHPEGADS